MSRIHTKLTVERNGGINVEDLKGSTAPSSTVSVLTASINHRDSSASATSNYR